MVDWRLRGKLWLISNGWPSREVRGVTVGLLTFRAGALVGVCWTRMVDVYVGSYGRDMRVGLFMRGVIAGRKKSAGGECTRQTDRSTTEGSSTDRSSTDGSSTDRLSTDR